MEKRIKEKTLSLFGDCRGELIPGQPIGIKMGLTKKQRMVIDSVLYKNKKTSVHVINPLVKKEKLATIKVGERTRQVEFAIKKIESLRGKILRKETKKRYLLFASLV